MKPEEQDRVERLLRQSVASVSSEAQGKLQRDLWPEMLRRLNDRVPAVPWFDWALLAVVVFWLALFHKALPMFLYHL